MEQTANTLKRILFVDDDPNVLTGLRNVLRTKRRDVDDRIVVQETAQRSEEIAEIGAGERVAEAIGEGQQPSAGVQKPEQRLDFLRAEERGRIG